MMGSQFEGCYDRLKESLSNLQKETRLVKVVSVQAKAPQQTGSIRINLPVLMKSMEKLAPEQPLGDTAP